MAPRHLEAPLRRSPEPAQWLKPAAILVEPAQSLRPAVILVEPAQSPKSARKTASPTLGEQLRNADSTRQAGTETSAEVSCRRC